MLDPVAVIAGLSLAAGIGVLLAPRLLHYIIGGYLIIVGILGLIG